MPDDAIEREQLALERERLHAERQKVALEFRLKRRELAERRDKSWKELLANPLTLAIAGGFLTLMTTIVSTHISAIESRTLESQRATLAHEVEEKRAELAQKSAREALQAELIKKFVESPKTETVRENLHFLVDTGLLPDYAKNIRTYLENNPKAAPTVSVVPAVVGPTDQRIVLSNVSPAQRAKFQGVGLLRVALKTGEIVCSGFLASPTIIVTEGPCLDTPDAPQSAIFAPRPLGDSSIKPRELIVDFARRVIVKGPPASGTYRIEIALAPVQGADSSGLAYHPLASRPPQEGEPLEMGFYSADKKDWVYSAGDNCRVTQVGNSELQHRCDTGGGASGTPLLSSAGTVIGVHAGLGSPGSPEKRALRTDVIWNDPGVRQAFGALPTTGPALATP
jgi:V8-like Glu-specific endopeptidase